MNKLVTVGDIHGSVIGLISFLVDSKVINNTSEVKEFYNIMLHINRNKLYDSISRDILQKVYELAKKFQIGEIKKIRFLGDVFADRGWNDLLTMVVIGALVENSLEVKFMFSNHDAELLYAYYISETNKLNNSFKLSWPTVAELEHRGLISHRNMSLSLHNMLRSIAKDESLNLIASNFLKEVFIPNLYLLDYGNINEKSGAKKCNIYSHAPLCTNNIIDLILDFSCDPLDKSLAIDKLRDVITNSLDDPDFLINHIDLINCKVREKFFFNRMQYLKSMKESDSFSSDFQIFFFKKDEHFKVQYKSLYSVYQRRMSHDNGTLYFGETDLPNCVENTVHGHDIFQQIDGYRSINLNTVYINSFSSPVFNFIVEEDEKLEKINGLKKSFI